MIKQQEPRKEKKGKKISISSVLKSQLILQKIITSKSSRPNYLFNFSQVLMNINAD
jgi:hypothetical protein